MTIVNTASVVGPAAAAVTLALVAATEIAAAAQAKFNRLEMLGLPASSRPHPLLKRRTRWPKR